MKESHGNQLFEMMADGVWQVNAAAETIFFNSRMHTMLGYSRAEFACLPVLACFAEEARPGIAARMASRRLGVRDNYECELVHKDGSLVSAAIEAIPLQRDDGEYDGTLAMVADLTAHKKAEEALRQSEGRIRFLVEAANVGLWDLNLETNEAYLSPEWKRQLGYADHEVANHFEEFERRLHPADREPTLAAVADFREGRCASYKPEFRMRHRNGSWRWILAQAQLSRDAAGRPLRMMGSHIDITDSKEAAEALRRSEERLHLILRGSKDAPWDWDLRTNAVYYAPHWWAMLGYTQNEFDCSDISNSQHLLHPDDRLRADEVLNAAIKGGPDSYELEIRLRHKKGHYVPILSRGFILRNRNGVPIRVSATNTDLTERKQAEERRAKLESQLQQAQKMESVGRLAGGVAHDFNNMLAVILGYTELAIEETKPGLPLHDHLVEIRKAANRSADLTRQLLAFARKQIITPRVLNLNEALAGMMNMLQRLIGEDIVLTWLPTPGLWPVKADPSQLDQILANLCVNARDAIVGVGKLSIETGNSTIEDDDCAAHGEVAPGDYVGLIVTDDGCGMSQETLSHLFEPFFTTKPLGVGTGLGLATVYGIVKQNHGFIQVSSEPGQGSRFTIYLPRHVGTTEPGGGSTAKSAPRGHETILVVEDDPDILLLTTRMLKRMGYTLLAANAPSEAMRLGREHAGAIHLLLTDVIMPEMNGRDLANNLKALYPGLKRLFMSGYTANLLAPSGVLEEGLSFLQKPFTLRDLAAKVREVLDTQ